MKTFLRNGRAKLPAIAGLSLAAAGAITLADRPSLLHAAPFASDSAKALVARTASPGVAKLEDLSNAFATIAARIKPSVVYITAKEGAEPVAQHQAPQQRGQRRGQGQMDPDQLPPELRQMLRGFGGGMQMMPDGGDDAPERPRGGGMASGSGFIVSQDGYILTNNHVVDGATDVHVRLLDRREYKAKVIGRDPNTDVAVIKIDATGLTPAPLGDSEASRVGEWVLAIGNPLGENLTFTVTQGIISAKGRALQLPGQSQQTIQDFIQTDAAINPGNSGGPLVNVNGNVIGINSAIESPTGYNAGYGFAVPINLARSVMNEIIKTGHVERVALGVQVRDANGDDAAYAGLKTIGGVLVEGFGTDNSAAEKAGLQAGDVITAVDGKKIEYVAQLQQAIAFRHPGDVVSVDVARKGGKTATVRVPLQRIDATMNESRASNDDANNGDTGASNHQLGVSVAPVDAQAAREWELPSDIHGLVVTGVKDGTSAAKHLATPEGGPDIILSVEGKPVQTVDQLREALANTKNGDIVSLNVYNAQAKTKRIERVRVGTTEE
ncbi:MAG: trypsin-like peptidase domain-containing protein [Gemmatimonadaceae bacterium]